MNRILACLGALGLAAGLAAQPPRSTNSLEFEGGGKLTISYAHLDLAQGVTLKNLLAKDEQGDRFRAFFNEQGFKNRIAAVLEVSAPTVLADNELDPGKYHVSFRVDDDLIWYVVVLTQEDEEIFSATLDVKKDDENASDRLTMQPLATDNAGREGELEIRFGHLTAMVGFRAEAGERREEEK